MASSAPPWPNQPGRTARTGPPGWVGLLLALPMFAGTVWWLVIPTIQTVVQSLTGKAPMIAGDGKIYTSHQPGVLTGTGDALGRTLVIALVPTLVMLIVVPLLSFAAAGAGGPLRKAVRVVLTVPIAGFAPAITMLAWIWFTAPDHALSSLRPITGSALPKVALIAGLSVLGLVAGIGVSVLLAALRRRADDTPRRTVRAGLAVWAVLVLGTLAFGMQSVILVLGLTSGGPGTSTTTLGLLDYRYAFQQMRFGAGAAAGTVLLVPVMLLGIAATLIVVLSRTRLELADRGDNPAPVGRGRAIGLGIVALVASLLLVALELVPRSSLLGDHTAHTPDTTANTLLYVVLPAVVTAVVQLALAYPAGVGIGAFRPLGRHSNWLLLPFAPWLFVTVTPLMTTYWQATSAAKSVDTWLGAVSPILVSVPALLVFTLFAAGHGDRWRAQVAAGRRGAFARTVLVPSLPLVALVATVILLVEAHSAFWRLLVLTSHQTPSILLFQLANQFSGQTPGVGLLLAAAPFAIPAFVALAVLQILYVDRLTVRVGAQPSAAPAQAWGAPGGPTPGAPGPGGVPGAGGTPGAWQTPGQQFPPGAPTPPGQPEGPTQRIPTGPPEPPTQQVPAPPAQPGQQPGAPWGQPGQPPAGPAWGTPPPAAPPVWGNTPGTPPGGPHLGGLPPTGPPPQPDK